MLKSFDHLSPKIFTGKIAIAAGTLNLRRTLTSKSNGELATVTDREGRERLTSVAYEATVRSNSRAACAGMRGRSRFLVGHRSSWQWVSRWYRQTFNFRL